jgi:hypothetical protein
MSQHRDERNVISHYRDYRTAEWFYVEEDNVLNVVKIFPVVSRYRMLLNVCEDKKKDMQIPQTITSYGMLMDRYK